MLVDPESVKKIDHLTVIFTHLGSAHVKAVRIHVGEIDPWCFGVCSIEYLWIESHIYFFLVVSLECN